MLGELSEQQIESLLKQQVIGRIGCYAKGCCYVVPVNYVYDGTCIYGHSAQGQKISMMRKNPQICFEVDDIQSVFHWKSVIAWGHFEEITNADERERTMQRLIHRIMPLTNGPADHPWHGITENEKAVGDTLELIVYKIILTKKTGRFEGS